MKDRIASYIKFKISNNHYLIVSTLLLFIPIIFFMKKTKKNIYEYFLVLLLIINIFLSCVFWKDAKKYSLIHLFDGFFGKTSLFLFTIYILYHKKNEQHIIYLTILFLSMIAFYYSNLYSSRDWCCNKHIFYHSIFHLLISFGACYAFV
jgi:hypothetical protein